MSLHRSQGGFTLIELIAILIILGVLASVAVPKYYDLTKESQNRAALQAVLEGKARLSLQYARLFLNNGAPPGVSSLIETVGVTTSVGDYTLNLSTADTLNIKIIAAGRGSVQGTNSGVWVKPR